MCSCCVRLERPKYFISEGGLGASAPRVGEAGACQGHTHVKDSLGWGGGFSIKRCTLGSRSGKVEHVSQVWYSVLSPDENAKEVVAWLECDQL